MIISAAMLAACGSAETMGLQAEASAADTAPATAAAAAAYPVPTTEPDVPAAPVPTTAPDEMFQAAQLPDDETETAGELPVSTIIKVRDGDTLRRDIIPQIVSAVDMPERYVEDALSQAQSELISEDASSYARMEGIIPPGSYDISGMTLSECVQMWISKAEKRYKRINGRVWNQNSLTAAERMILASIVEGETVLSDDDEYAVAAALLNRLAANDRLCSDATVAYAQGFERPYLTSDDIGTDSPYNTYAVSALPPGAICCMDDQSLRVACTKAKNKSTYYFFYDYAKRKIREYSSYEEYISAEEESEARFDETFDIGRNAVINKRAFFG